VKKLVKFVGEENFKVNSAVKSVTREHNSKVLLKLENGTEEEFDAVVFATHADTTLELIRGDSTTEERQALNPFQYKPNTAYLHGFVRAISIFHRMKSENRGVVMTAICHQIDGHGHRGTLHQSQVIQQ
jgi:predicted NAD/FAD-binding protein